MAKQRRTRRLVTREDCVFMNYGCPFLCKRSLITTDNVFDLLADFVQGQLIDNHTRALLCCDGGLLRLPHLILRSDITNQNHPAPAVAKLLHFSSARLIERAEALTTSARRLFSTSTAIHPLTNVSKQVIYSRRNGDRKTPRLLKLETALVTHNTPNPASPCPADSAHNSPSLKHATFGDHP